MTSIVGTANAFQLETQIQLIGRGLKEYCDQLTTFVMGLKEKNGIRYAFWKLDSSSHAPSSREAGPIRVTPATGRNFLMKATRGENHDPAS